MDYTVHPALAEDTNSGWCWIRNENIKSRKLIIIENKDDNAIVICEALAIDENYENYHSAKNIYGKANPLPNCDNLIVINAWYREKLKITEKKTYNLKVKVISEYQLFDRFRACSQHPQIAIRISSWLGLLGVLFGFIGLIGFINTMPYKLATMFFIGILVGRFNKERYYIKDS